jgi:ATP-binding protein involved in chromosome partitioning
MVTTDQVIERLRGVMDPELKRSLVELGMVRNVQVQNSRVGFTLTLTTLACPLKDQIVADAKQAILALNGIKQVEVELAEMSAEDKQKLGLGTPQPGQAEPFNDIRHVIAVVSGKGGVGKSLVSGLLAVALRREGYQVGVLDADITGPSIPKMFFATSVRPGASVVAILPPESRTGIKVMSINLLLESDDQAVIWRGPIISRVIQQFWGDVLWKTLDYLIVDLPPGTSDASLTVMQSLPSSGIVLVTSPQDLAGMVVRKAAQMAQQIGIPILGLIENMSYFVCPDTGKRHDIFGISRAEGMAAQMGIPFLGRLPIDPEIARLCDAGRIEDYSSEAFRPMGQRIAELATALQPPRMPSH